MDKDTWNCLVKRLHSHSQWLDAWNTQTWASEGGKQGAAKATLDCKYFPLTFQSNFFSCFRVGKIRFHQCCIPFEKCFRRPCTQIYEITRAWSYLAAIQKHTLTRCSVEVVPERRLTAANAHMELLHQDQHVPRRMLHCKVATKLKRLWMCGLWWITYAELL